MKRPQVTVLVDTRDMGRRPETFQVARISMQGVASEVAPGNAEWERLKAVFLKKNPSRRRFSATALRMLRVKPQRVSYANGLQDSFKAEF